MAETHGHAALELVVRMRRAGYSIWTGYSFKAPLLASAVACLLGNLAYSLSYDARALWLLVLARLVTGLGAAPP